LRNVEAAGNVIGDSLPASVAVDPRLAMAPDVTSEVSRKPVRTPRSHGILKLARVVGEAAVTLAPGLPP
jgi:hypothetical protein